MTTFGIALLILFLLPVALLAQTDLTAGSWYNEEKTGRIRFYMLDSELHGKVVWFKHEDRKDKNNPDPSLQERFIIGITVLSGFVSKDQTIWTGGRVYDPESGKTYSSKITVLSDNEISMRGYIGTPLMGRSTRLTRAD